MEIDLASKRKLGFVTRAVKRDNNDNVKQVLGTPVTTLSYHGYLDLLLSL